jgi:hypothetical protein
METLLRRSLISLKFFLGTTLARLRKSAEAEGLNNTSIFVNKHLLIKHTPSAIIHPMEPSVSQSTKSVVTNKF